MDNRSIKDLIISCTIQTSALITIWGLTNYMKLDYDLDNTIIYQSKFFNINIKITGKIFYGFAILISNSVIILNTMIISKQWQQ